MGAAFMGLTSSPDVAVLRTLSTGIEVLQLIFRTVGKVRATEVR